MLQRSIVMPNRPRPPNGEKLNGFQFLLEEIKDVGVFSMDLERAITSWSPGVERILGYSEADFLGQNANVLFTPEDREQKLDDAEFARARTEGRAPDLRWHMKKNGSRVFVDGALRAAFDDDGQHIGYIKIVRNINPKGVGEHILGTILERTPDAIYIHDHQGRYAYVNSETARIIGRDPDEILGHSLDEFFPTHIGGPMHKNNASVMETKTPRIMEEQMLTRDHGQRTYLAGKAPWQDSDGNMLGVVSISQDISARKGLEEERERLLRELRRSNEDLAQFSHVVSHDLQAPLRMVNSYTELLKQRYYGKLDDTADQFIRVILNGAAGMDQLIRSLLQYAQAGEPSLQKTQVRIEAIIDGARSNLQPVLKETSAEVTHDGLPTLPGDPVQLLQLFQNIIGNAIKYGRANVTPRIHILAEQIDHEVYRFAISDNGAGIDAKNYDRVFAPLKRLHGQEIPGSGIGLAICKKIVERHGGQIWVESQVGKGSTFYFTLRAQP
jgi:PAS domain S-box-containing protein